MKVETEDLFCGAYLMDKGGYLTDVRVGVGKGKYDITFVFEGEEIKSHLDDYNSGMGTVNVASYKSWLNHLKDVMFDRIRRGKEQKLYVGKKRVL